MTTNFYRAEEKVFSRFNEDGVINAVFMVIEPTSRFVVDIGAGDGICGSNSRNLLRNGWEGLLLDRDPNPGVAQVIGKDGLGLERDPGQVVIQADVTPKNVEAVFRQQHVPYDVDMLSIDIDGMDWYVWQAIKNYKPKLVVVEYNPSFPPPAHVVVPYEDNFVWDESDYYGASLQALCNLGEDKGYRLIHCESNGANAFFVHEKFYDLFGLEDIPPEKLYRLPSYGVRGRGRAPNGLGHKRSSRW